MESREGVEMNNEIAPNEIIPEVKLEVKKRGNPLFKKGQTNPYYKAKIEKELHEFIDKDK